MMRRPLALLVLMAAPALAQAAGGPLDGNYGNKEGCIYARTGDSSGADDFFLLTKEALTTSVAACEIKKIGKTNGDATDVTFSCQAEGEDSGGDIAGKVIRTGKDAVKVTMDDGSSYGPYKRCK